MVAEISQAVGFLGTALVLAAYFPQIVHLVRERCSYGLSERAFIVWMLASLLFLVHAVVIRDPVFMVLQGLNVAADGIIVVFAHRYEDGVCAIHFAPRPRRTT